MNNFDDFDLDLTKVSSQADQDTMITSKSACTPGCVTGVLETCNNNTNTCSCIINN